MTNESPCDYVDGAVERDDELQSAFADVWSAILKVVFSRTLDSVQGNARLAAGSVAEEAAAVKPSVSRPASFRAPWPTSWRVRLRGFSDQG